MPFPRFYKQPIEKRERLMEAAAQEFATHGFDDASVNRILETVKMSKGAAYYYFEDKVDLFFTVIQYCIERVKLDLELDPATLTAENFWPTFAELHRQPLLRSFEQPWLFAAVRAAEHLSPAARQREPLATFARQVKTWMMNIVKRGQELASSAPICQRISSSPGLPLSMLPATTGCSLTGRSSTARPSHIFPTRPLMACAGHWQSCQRTPHCSLAALSGRIFTAKPQGD